MLKPSRPPAHSGPSQFPASAQPLRRGASGCVISAVTGSRNGRQRRTIIRLSFTGFAFISAGKSLSALAARSSLTFDFAQNSSLPLSLAMRSSTTSLRQENNTTADRTQATADDHSLRRKNRRDLVATKLWRQNVLAIPFGSPSRLHLLSTLPATLRAERPLKRSLP
jgi:hypothetical protein